MKCTHSGCTNEQRIRGLCRNHYEQYRSRDIIEPVRHHESHGMHGTPEFNSWANMVQRCTNKKYKRYKDWGGRGIKVCNRYRYSFKSLYDDIGLRPEGTTLDRNNNDGHYSCGKCEQCIANGWPMNIHWATATEQQINTRIRIDNRSGHKNISWRKQAHLWNITVQRSKKTIYQARFDELSDAIEARDMVLREYDRCKSLDKNIYINIGIDARRIRSKLSGERGPGAKITWKEVREIRELWLKGGLYQREIGEMFGISESRTSHIAINHAWVDEEYGAKLIKHPKKKVARLKPKYAS